jgi:hypothetical protein
MVDKGLPARNTTHNGNYTFSIPLFSVIFYILVDDGATKSSKTEVIFLLKQVLGRRKQNNALRPFFLQ